MEKRSEDNQSSSFLRRLRQNVSESVSRPVPGVVKVKLNESTSIVSNFLNNAFGNSSFASQDIDQNEKAPKEVPSFPQPLSKPPAVVSAYRITQFESLLGADNVDLAALRKLCWNGCTPAHRPMCWQLMLGYLPTNKARRENTIHRKRKEYRDAISMYYEVADADRTTQEGEILRQILVDIPRTSPHTPLFQQRAIQKCMERILYIWSIRHPAAGYVQGMNDLVTPLIYICIAPFVLDDVIRCDTELIDPETLLNIEADTFWCLTKLLDNIQDHYTFSQPGLQRMVLRLEDLIHRLDSDLFNHFEAESVQFMQFSFRWMNCLLLRELPLRSVLRLWDTYLAEEGGFENFHVYVCVVLLKTYADKLMGMSFQDLLVFLQDLPTASWVEEDIEPILSQAYILSTLFENSPSHLS